MGADCKSAGYAYAGSNPARPIHGTHRAFLFYAFKSCPCGSVVEHTLGKGEVTSSILVTGSLTKYERFSTEEVNSVEFLSMSRKIVVQASQKLYKKRPR